MSDTRESWLRELTDALRPDFERIGFALPEKIRTSCGFPSKGALALKARRIGECWSNGSSEDGHFETFVSPLLSDVIHVAATQVHELCHAAVGVDCGHRKPFPKAAKAIGLEGKMTVTEAGPELKRRLEELIAQIGSYPHAALVKSSGPKKQGIRQRKIICTNPQCGCICRMTRKWVEVVGTPTCGCGSPMKLEESADKEESEDGEDR